MRLKHILTLISGLFLLLPASCSRDEEWKLEDNGFALIINPQVSSGVTKSVAVPSVQALREDAVESLNVYFYGTFRGESAPSLKHYFLESATDKTGTDSWRVTSDWRSDGFVNGNAYDMYVVANSSKVKTASQTSGSYLHSATEPLSTASVTSLAGLKSMIEFDYEPSEQNGEGGHKPYWGVNDEDNLNPEWLNLHKKYIPSSTMDVSAGNSQQRRFYTNEKTFLMDGKTSFTAGSTSAIPLELTRAAAKVVIDVKFDPVFLSSLASNNIEVTGAPAWRFFNFSFSTPVIDPSLISGTAESYNKSVFVAGAIMMGKGDVDTDLVYSTDADKHFSFSTYTYPTSWSVSSATTEAPAIILSLGYTDNTNPSSPTTTYEVYKVPVVDPEGSVTSIERNKLYRVSATIASEGGELLTDAFKVRCDYDVIPWGDIPSNPDDIAVVDHSNNDYFDVSPLQLVLRGDGLQVDSVTVIKPNKRAFKLQYFSDVAGATMETPLAVSTSDTRAEYPFVNDVAENAPAPYYFNYIGDKRNVFEGTRSRDGITFGTDTYLQNKFIRHDRSLVVNSYELPNMAIKYMKVRVYLDVTDWESKGYYRDITIIHYPTNSITHRTGAWSSRLSACSALDPSDPNYEPFSTSTGPFGPEEYKYNTSTDRYELNPDHFPTTPQAWRKYRWVNYDVDNTGTHTYRTYSRGNDNSYNGPYRPKYWTGTNMYYMTANNTSTGGRVTQGSDRGSASNPRMFIVQATSTSSSAVMGRPDIDENGLSSDRVFSPAFMIASQLAATANLPSVSSSITVNNYGTVSVGSATELNMWAARHCASYLEVGTDGTYYKNWRLPTQDEINLLISLQATNVGGVQTATIDGVTITGNDRVLDNVLTAGWYRALDGNVVRSNPNLETSTVRCIRDLTQAEIDALNGLNN